VVDEVRVVRLLRAARGAVNGLRIEQTAGKDSRADAIWLPGVTYLLISDLKEFIAQVSRWPSIPPQTP
jgi:hypothetical protein